MSIGFRIAHLSIGKQVMLTALLPLLLLTFALSGYMISSRIQDAQRALDDEAETLLEFLSAAAEFGLLTQNVEVLTQLARGPTKRPEISNIMFVNAQSQLLYQSQEIALDFERILSEGLGERAKRRIDLAGLTHSWLLVKPVVMSAVTVDDFDLSLAPERHLGAVVLIVNDQELIERQQQIVFWGLLIAVVGLLSAALLASRIGRNISLPIETLSRSLTHYESGIYEPIIDVGSQHEIGALQRGVAALIDQVGQHQQRLQRDIDQATADLQSALTALEQSHQALQLSKDQIELSGRAKDDFMARMSHELRTPISSVIGFVQLLQKSDLREGQKEYCRIILSASSLLLRLIDDILDFSKFQSDNLQLEHIPFSPERCLEDILEMQAPAAAQKGLELSLKADAPWPLLLMGDPTRFSQIVSNLISNAIKFTEKGQVQIQLAGLRQQEQTKLQITIKDTGIGIAADELATLFQPFTQADTSISRRFGGSGLGLVISKRLVELMHGDLHLTSVLGEGSQFTINLSLDNAAQPLVKSLPVLNVLLCCSDHPCRSQFEEQIRAWGCQVESLDDRQQLVPHLQSSGRVYDRVFLYFTPEELRALSWSLFLNPVRECYTGELILITEQGDDEIATERLLEPLAPATLSRLPLGRYRLFSLLEAPLLSSTEALQPQLSLQGLTLLVAEDNSFNRLLLTRMLQAQGALVEPAANGREALALAEQKAVDLIIMDLHMPNMGGAEACQRIRQLPSKAAQTPILILTADVISDEELFESLELQGILYKPIDELTLVKQVLAVLRPDEGGARSDIAMRLQRFGIPEQELKQALEEQLSALQQALLMGDTTSLREQAHQLSGLAAMVGLNRLDDRVRAFGLAVKQDQMDEAWQSYWAIKSHFDKSNKVFDLS